MGPAGWNAILPAQAPARPLDRHIVADFAIVGGGFAGLSAARRLIQLNPDASVVLLEAGRIAEGATGRNSGFMIDLPHDLTSEDYSSEGDAGDRELISLNRLAIRFAAEAVEDYGVDPAFFEPAGKVNGATTDQSHRQNISYAAHLDALKEPYEELDAKAMTELTGSRYYVSGLHTPGTVMLQPAGYVRGLAAGLASVVQIFDETPVLSFEQTGQDWSIETSGGRVTAKKIILANNGHLESFGFQRRRLMHIFLFACMTKELDPAALDALEGQSRWGITPSNPMGTTVRKIDGAQGGHRIVIRTCADFRPEMETSKGRMLRASHVMRRKFDDRFPKLAGIEMEYHWAGHLCLSRNGVSVSKELAPGVFSACCQNGLGTTRGVLTGIAAAEMASGVSSDITRYFEAEPPPKRLPPPPFSTIGANAYLRWKEWQAGRD